MAEKFEVRIKAEHFIHNDLSNCANVMRKIMGKKFESQETSDVYSVMMSSLIFSAFSIEAKVNFVGWKVLENDWPERKRPKEKIDLLIQRLSLNLNWGERPLQTITTLIDFRNTVAHGKPDIVDKLVVTHVEPDIWEFLKAEWEALVTPENVEQCYEDTEELWSILLKAAEIPDGKTLTSVGIVPVK